MSIQERVEMERRKKLAKCEKKQTSEGQTGETREKLKLRNQEANE